MTTTNATTKAVKLGADMPTPAATRASRPPGLTGAGGAARLKVPFMSAPPAPQSWTDGRRCGQLGWAGRGLDQADVSAARACALPRAIFVAVTGPGALTSLKRDVVGAAKAVRSNERVHSGLRTFNFLKHAPRFSVPEELRRIMPPFSIVGAATVTVGLIFPAFRTMQAIEQSSSGTQRWAQFWTLIGILGGIDYLFSFILHHVPLYPYLKLGIVSWLLPAENVQWAYRVCILPNLGHYQHHIDSALQQGGVMASGVVTAAAGMLPTQARSQVLRGLGQDGLATTQAARGAHAEPDAVPTQQALSQGFR